MRKAEGGGFLSAVLMQQYVL